ncbi:hypothetical protein PR048_015799 [Dryococelus australis]|uniref:Uncharacterized protein n=1 Tax=Dryococelus australis TaxID=614101 RepID=A0ABQ9HJ17_9NEOP|nr:hypothetical protein PR048_015799 [Dryococelus australis]
MKGRGKREIPEKTRRPTASSGTIPTCENPVTRTGIEPSLPWWEVSVPIAQQPTHNPPGASGFVAPGVLERRTGAAPCPGETRTLTIISHGRVAAGTSEYGAASELIGAGGVGDPRENPPTNGIVQHMRKSGGEPAENRTRFALPIRVARGRYGATQECKGRGTGDPREVPPTSGIVRYDSYVRKSGERPRGNRTRSGEDMHRRGRSVLFDLVYVSPTSMLPVFSSILTEPQRAEGNFLEQNN